MADKQIQQIQKTLGKIAMEVVKHSASINKLLLDVTGLKDQGLKVVNSQDKMMAIVERLDKERTFTFEAVG
jgi:hypothetical protein